MVLPVNGAWRLSLRRGRFLFVSGVEESKFEEVSFDIRNVIILLNYMDTRNLLLGLIVGVVMIFYD
jgi:hypothetical protein